MGVTWFGISVSTRSFAVRTSSMRVPGGRYPSGQRIFLSPVPRKYCWSSKTPVGFGFLVPPGNFESSSTGKVGQFRGSGYCTAGSQVFRIDSFDSESSLVRRGSFPAP